MLISSSQKESFHMFRSQRRCARWSSTSPQALYFSPIGKVGRMSMALISRLSPSRRLAWAISCLAKAHWPRTRMARPSSVRSIYSSVSFSQRCASSWCKMIYSLWNRSCSSVSDSTKHTITSIIVIAIDMKHITVSLTDDFSVLISLVLSKNKSSVDEAEKVDRMLSLIARTRLCVNKRSAFRRNGIY